MHVTCSPPIDKGGQCGASIYAALTTRDELHMFLEKFNPNADVGP